MAFSLPGWHFLCSVDCVWVGWGGNFSFGSLTFNQANGKMLETKCNFTDTRNSYDCMCYHNLSFHFSVGSWKTVVYAMIPIRKDSCLGLYGLLYLTFPSNSHFWFYLCPHQGIPWRVWVYHFSVWKGAQRTKLLFCRSCALWVGRSQQNFLWLYWSLAQSSAWTDTIWWWLWLVEVHSALVRACFTD